MAHQITEFISVSTEGDVVLLEIKGEQFALSAGEAYVLGQTVSRVGYESLDPKLAAKIFPGGGDKCEPPPPGSGVRYIGSFLFGGGGGCPPPPPPIFLERELYGEMMAGSVEIVEAPDVSEREWMPVPGGFAMPY